ncbi:hypothetical protein [Spongiibacter tropicus]|uniref:hypothetical protein n=1 Tax=Spongiibacter tropicus TaxID=454602 RepID=UPI00235586BD|nr:hypothetical protein [Spongiibacter tropicus]
MPDQVRHDGLGGFRWGSELSPNAVTPAPEPGSSTSGFGLALWVNCPAVVLDAGSGPA